ncbi:MAG: 23S rRNA (adenine(2503)-C(2))-methyltransferase RlmN, partial [Terriglobia bacterium]
MNLFGLNRAELEELALACGEPRYRGRQLFHGIYGLRREATGSLTDLSKQFRQRLAERFHIALPAVREKFSSHDRAVRYLLELADGQAVESVFMPERDR